MREGGGIPVDCAQSNFSSFFFIDMLYSCIRITLANLCPNMIHFDALDFSECHSEEVISFY